MEEAV